MSLPVDPELSRLCAALTAAGDVAYDWDVAGDSVVWVGSAEALGQESFAPLDSGRALAQRVHPEDLPARQQRINQHFAEGDAFECEYRIRTANGTFQWVHDRGAAERDGEGRP